jgi:ABC-type phosphate transport system permease subunit
VVGAVMIGLGRAMGETIAVALTIGAAVQITPNLFAGGHALPAVIVLNWGDPGSPLGRSALIACGVVLFIITIAINLRARHRPPCRAPAEGSLGMTTVAPPRNELVPDGLRRRSMSRRRRTTDQVMKVLLWASVLFAVVPLGLVTAYVIVRGSGVMSWEFLTERIPRQALSTKGGIGPAIVGTVLTTGVASLIAIPLGILGAIYLNEYGKQNRLARTVRTMADVMTGVPSVMMVSLSIGFILLTGTNGCRGTPWLPHVPVVRV